MNITKNCFISCNLFFNRKYSFGPASSHPGGARLGLMPLVFSHVWTSKHVDRSAIGEQDLQAAARWNASQFHHVSPGNQTRAFPPVLQAFECLLGHHVIIRSLSSCNWGPRALLNLSMSDLIAAQRLSSQLRSKHSPGWTIPVTHCKS